MVTGNNPWGTDIVVFYKFKKTAIKAKTVVLYKKLYRPKPNKRANLVVRSEFKIFFFLIGAIIIVVITQFVPGQSTHLP